MNVRLMIDGLSGYLEEPFGSPSSVHILFPDLRKSVTRHSNIGDIVVCEHSPKLVLPDGTEWALDGEHIVIEGGAGLIALDSSYTDRMSDMKEIALGSEYCRLVVFGRSSQISWNGPCGPRRRPGRRAWSFQCCG